ADALLPGQCCSLLLFTDAAAQRLTQPRPSTSSRVMATARIDCRFSGSNFQNVAIHWYQQKPGEAPKRILYVTLSSKFKVQKHPSDSVYALIIHDLTPEDSGFYFCSYWFILRGTPSSDACCFCTTFHKIRSEILMNSSNSNSIFVHLSLRGPQAVCVLASLTLCMV
uniref:Ig-like domain-containing protein n=1 Tax=Nothoprocta perdicaria TaxID=30464 RepID=A0A8C6ZNL5_NOTPE